jgi:hypothetical protein
MGICGDMSIETITLSPRIFPVVNAWTVYVLFYTQLALHVDGEMM